MPVTNAVMLGDKVRTGAIPEKEGKALQEKGYKYMLGLVGPALSSFLQFSHRYYGDYVTDLAPGDTLNRHAIIHGSRKGFATKENVVRLFTYLYLILELAPVLNILLQE